MPFDSKAKPPIASLTSTTPEVKPFVNLSELPEVVRLPVSSTDPNPPEIETSALNTITEESLEEFQPEKVFYVYDRDTILEAEVTGEDPRGGLNLKVSGVAMQKFQTSASTGLQIAEFLNVRKGSGRADVGSYFIE